MLAQNAAMSSSACLFLTELTFLLTLKISLMMDHINSYGRESLGNSSPYGFSWPRTSCGPSADVLQAVPPAHAEILRSPSSTMLRQDFNLIFIQYRELFPAVSIAFNVMYSASNATILSVNKTSILITISMLFHYYSI